MYKIPLRELKTRKIKVKLSKPHQRVKHLLSTHVLDTRKIEPTNLFFASLDEAKKQELVPWEKLEKTFRKRTRDIR